MKRTLASLITALLMIGTFSAFAAEKPNPLKDFSSKRILESYLEAITQGNPTVNKFLFAPDFEYRNSANNRVYSKKAYLSFLKASEKLVYNCKSTYSILDECGVECVAKITMVFDNFTRVDHISLNKSKEGWQVYKVVTTYP